MGRGPRSWPLSLPRYVARRWPSSVSDGTNAILVLNPQGDDLGYLRRGIAYQLAQRLKKKASLSGHVAAVLGEECDPNERLYVRVKVAQAG